ncbi:MAG: hypothetical protein NTX88_07145 [Candidatus Atribacteria bacterium]|nr:hypothetical protein [Candidatus Atribacteria bacterium]
MIQTVSAAPSGEFQWNWGDTGTTEGTVTFSFTATQGSLAESTKTNFDIVVDGQGPYLQSLSARADTILGVAPTIQVNFNEAINVGNLTLFTTPGFWAVSFLPAANGSFIVTNVALSADGESVTLTGRPLFDYMLQGTQVTVLFGWVALMQVEDDAENLFNATLNFTTGIVIP